MRIAIVHFHLQTGGVTRVIEHACSALTAAGHQVVVLSGEPPQCPQALSAPVGLVAELGYEERRPAAGPRELQHALQQSATAALGAAPDLWHIHNHCLGKNLALPQAILGLASSGHHLLLQPHDYAEDSRPALYGRMLEQIGERKRDQLAARLYPLAPQIHYAALSARDHQFLRAAGVPGERLHALPNAVALGCETGAISGEIAAHPEATPRQYRAREARGNRCWLYPTRAIRRKNLGELLLWAALAGPEDQFATTQAPQNPAERPIYDRWVSIAASLRLPVRFAIGAETADFPALLRASHALITTSIAEGFGLAFLEPWLIDRPLAGRDLPEITRDFAADGIRLSGLYQRLPVPLDWLDQGGLRARLDRALRNAAEAYQRPRPPNDLERAWAAALDQEGRIDFGRLDEIAQEQVLHQASAAPETAAAVLGGQSPPLATSAAGLEANRRIVERNYMIAGYQQRLETIYAQLLNERPGAITQHADGDALLDRFQAPERLHLLRT